MIIVSKNGDGNYSSITDAIKNVTDDTEIFIKNGLYNETVSIMADNITIRGESRENTIISFSNCATMLDDDGEKLGTFRTATFLALGNNITISDLTIRNDSGVGPEIGQAIALYAEGDMIKVKNCLISGNQDTLFTGPLPKQAKSAKGFFGPTEHFPRVLLHQLYEDCTIEGNVDFIFGSAIAYFDNCTINCIDRDYISPGGYITAPSTYEGFKYGYVFNNCRIISEGKPERFFLARPWRPYAKTAFLNTYMSECIIPHGYDNWNNADNSATVSYVEYNNSGPGAKGPRVPYVKHLTEKEAEEYTREKVLGWTMT